MVIISIVKPHFASDDIVFNTCRLTVVYEKGTKVKVNLKCGIRIERCWEHNCISLPVQEFQLNWQHIFLSCKNNLEVAQITNKIASGGFPQ